MITQDILDRASFGFASVLGQVTSDQWGEPTGNPGQDVRALVDHVIDGDLMSAVLLAGGSRADGLAQFGSSAREADPVAAFATSSRQLSAAFFEPGALDLIVAHPALDMPGYQLLGFRLGEYALHGWDLARAIGVDDTIDPDVVQALWDFTAPMADLMAVSGMFGEGSSGSVGADAPLMVRLLDLSGRRP